MNIREHYLITKASMLIEEELTVGNRIRIAFCVWWSCDHSYGSSSRILCAVNFTLLERCSGRPH